MVEKPILRFSLAGMPVCHIITRQSVVSGIVAGMDKEPMMNMEFRRDEKGGSGGVFVK
jgi:hypothetical protein